MSRDSHGSRRHRQRRRPQVSVRISRPACRHGGADRDRARGRGRDREVDALERCGRDGARAGASRALLAADRVGARSRPCGSWRPVRRSSRRRPAGPDRAAPPGTRGRAPARGCGGSSGRPAGSRGRRSQRPGAARRGWARRRDRRPSVARRLIRECARVRTSSAARGEHAARLDTSARRGRAEVSGRGGARRGPDRPCSRRAAQCRGNPPAGPRPAFPHGGPADVAPAARGIGWESLLCAGDRAGTGFGERGSRSDTAAAGSGAPGGARVRPARRLHGRDA